MFQRLRSLWRRATFRFHDWTDAMPLPQAFRDLGIKTHLP
jgi:hypothetical protein